MGDRWTGIFAPLTTPFIEEDIAPEYLRENVLKYNGYDLSGYVVLGSTGEAVYLSDDESETIVRTAREASAGGKKIIAGTARESTRQAR